MKKSILMVMALMVLAVPTVTGQKINQEAVLAKLTKCDADSENAKKAGKAATWVNRTKGYADAILEPTKSLFIGLDATMLRYTMGEPEETSADKSGRQVWDYEWVNVYIKDNRVASWTQKKEIKEGAFEAVVESANKALSLDAKSGAKLKTILDGLITYYSQSGSASIDIPDYRAAVDAYVKAALLQEIPVYEKVDPQYYFFAGQLAAFLGAEDAKYYADGEKYLNKSKELGYMDESGNTYYFLFHCYYGQKDIDKANLIKAKDALLEGIQKFPKNDRILDGLMSLYTAEDNVGDPADLVELIDKALAETPDSPDLWFGRGRVFFKLKNYDECIASFKKIDELKPNDFDTNFYIGYFYIAKGDGLNQKLNEKVDSISSMEEYQAEQAKVHAVYKEAVPYFEKAFDLKPDNLDCAQSLKELCFRLRNEEGMMEKYNKYNAAYKKLKGIE
ncbi:MAG: hypothetical protein IJ348_06590 [Alistipes sp.]|nr:hypothetical protein [Alistipes sp.]